MRRYDFTQSPQPLIVELHDQDCSCAACEPYSPSAPARLTDGQIARWAGAGFLAGHAIAMAIWGPATVARVLWANLTGQAL